MNTAFTLSVAFDVKDSGHPRILPCRAGAQFAVRKARGFVRGASVTSADLLGSAVVLEGIML